MIESCELSVVVACPDHDASALGACVGALGVAIAGLNAEIVVVAPRSAAAGGSVEGVASGARVVRSQGRLTPELWASGLEAARGRVVAFTIPQCVVDPDWARALMRALGTGAVGAGGTFELGGSASATDAAVCYLRYARFLAPAPGVRTVADVAGDNAAYRRDALARHAASFSEGFWEVDFHRRVQAEGGLLVLTGEARVRFSGAPSLRSMASQRFVHGRHFGAWRARTGGRAAWMSAAAFPLVPPLLLWRIVRLVWPRAGQRSRLLASMPALSVLSLAWAAGEVWGAFAGAPRNGAPTSVVLG